jgi:hypothetical protein
MAQGRQKIAAERQDDQRAVSIRSFDGMAPNSDPHDVKPGTSLHQVNVIAGPPGELRVRLGCRNVKFDT